MSSEWHCRTAGTVSGPFSLDELRLLVKRGRLGGDDAVRRGASGSWVPVRSVPGLLPDEPERSKTRRASTPSRPSVQPDPVPTDAAAAPSSAVATRAAPTLAQRPPPRIAQGLSQPPSSTRKQVAIAGGIALLFVVAVFVLLLWSREGGGAGQGTAGTGFGAGSGEGLGATAGGDATDDDESIVEVIEEPPGTQAGAANDASSAAGTAQPPPRVELSAPPDDLPLFTLNQLPQARATESPSSPRSIPRQTDAAVASSGAGGASVEERLEKAGAKTGDVQLSLIWNNRNDLDLHVECPSGEEIYHRHKQSQCGGELDVDMNAGVTSEQPVENVHWPKGKAPRGTYRVFVHHYRNKGGSDPTAFQVTVKVDAGERTFRGRIAHGQPRKLVHTFTRGAGN